MTEGDRESEQEGAAEVRIARRLDDLGTKERDEFSELERTAAVPIRLHPPRGLPEVELGRERDPARTLLTELELEQVQSEAVVLLVERAQRVHPRVGLVEVVEIRAVG